MLLLLAAGVAGCSSTRSVELSAARPALLMAGRCPLCVGTGPCRYTFSRQTCFGYDSSSGFTELRAVLDDGRCQIVMARTCGLRQGERIHFDLQPDHLRHDRLACGVGRDGRPWPPARDCPPRGQAPGAVR